MPGLFANHALHLVKFPAQRLVGESSFEDVKPTKMATATTIDRIRSLYCIQVKRHSDNFSTGVASTPFR